MSFTPRRLLQTLEACLATRQSPDTVALQRLYVAYSGGLDSHVLLHALNEIREDLPASLHAVHINHGLQQDSDEWAEHCARVCAQLDISMQVISVKVIMDNGESPEAAARQARYQALRDMLTSADALLTAQHLDDQAETFMLQLLRGAGARGQSCMPARSRLGEAVLLRPLLNFSQQSLCDYADESGIEWVEDPSNQDTDYDRNYLRHEVMPVLRSRWPAVDQTFARVAAQQAETEHLLQDLGRQDMQTLLSSADQSLSIAGLKELTGQRQRNVLRVWLYDLALPVPSRRKLLQAQHDMLHAREDRNPCVDWQGAELRRYRDRLHAMPPLALSDQDLVLHWDLVDVLCLPAGSGNLVVQKVIGKGLRQELCQSGGVQVRFRQGGERCQPDGRDHHHSLKNLFQEAGIPPWQRERTPLIYVNNELAAVPGLCLCKGFAAEAGMPGIEINWCQQSPSP